MIREANISDKEAIEELGFLLNKNYNKLFLLDEILKHNYEKIYVYEQDQKVVGFIHLQIFDYIDIINIVVTSTLRYKGIGSKLLDYSLSQVNFDVKKVFLEVASNNKEARMFYKKHDFKEISIRKNYYPNDDAIILEKVIN